MHSLKRMKGSEELQVDLRLMAFIESTAGLHIDFFFIFIDFSLIEAVRWDDVQLSFYWAE